MVFLGTVFHGFLRLKTIFYSDTIVICFFFIPICLTNAETSGGMTRYNGMHLITNGLVGTFVFLAFKHFLLSVSNIISIRFWGLW